jgi:ABC-type phosphate transport system, periplasmic component
MLKKSSIAVVFCALAMLSVLISACGTDSGSSSAQTTPSPAATTPTMSSTAYTFQCVSGSVAAGGSTALLNMVTDAASAYKAKCSSANLAVQGGGSKTGLANANSGTWDIGDSDVPATATQTALVDHQVAVVIFTMVINQQVTGVTNLSTQQLQDIYEGKVTNWKQVSGNDLPIVVISRPASSGTRATFQKYILAGAVEKPAQANALSQDSTSLVLQSVSTTKGAIGYAALGDASKKATVTILNIDGKAPNVSNIKTNDYKFWNIEHMYTKGAATGLAQSFINFVIHDPAAQTVKNNYKFANVSDINPDALAAHNSAK